MRYGQNVIKDRYIFTSYSSILWQYGIFSSPTISWETKLRNQTTLLKTRMSWLSSTLVPRKLSVKAQSGSSSEGINACGGRTCACALSVWLLCTNLVCTGFVHVPVPCLFGSCASCKSVCCRMAKLPNRRRQLPGELLLISQLLLP